MRLTKTDRYSIVDKALASRFDAEQEAVRKEIDALALDVYGRAYPKAVRKWAAEAPEGWLYKQSYVDANLSGFSVRLYFEKPVSVPYECRRVPVADEEARDRWVDLTTQRDRLVTERTVLRAQLLDMVGRFNTLEKLKDAWPEGASFWEHLSPKARVEVPAVQVAELNKMLGL